MKIFAGPRGSGRTTALVRWARQDATRRDLVVTDESQRRRLIDTMNPGVPIHTYEDMTRIQSYSDTEFGIDNYELFIGRPLPLYWQIKAITLESEDYINIESPVRLSEMCADLKAMERNLR